MSAFDNASKFFHSCESLEGWDECKQYVETGAAFRAQCEPLVDIETVEGYVDWMTAFGTTTAAGGRYELHSCSYDDMNRTAVFFATFSASHVGAGGPIPPTHRSTVTDYVYALTMNSADEVTRMCKVWNAPWAMRELGWI